MKENTRINNIFSIFVPTSVYNTSGTDIGSFFDSANVGKLAVFNAETNKTIASTDTGVSGTPFFLAWIPEEGKMKRSKGIIDPAKIAAITRRCPTAYQSKKVAVNLFSSTDVNSLVLQPNTEYVVKAILRNNLFFQTLGYGNFAAIATYATGSTVDVNDFIKSVVNQLNTNGRGYITATVQFWDSDAATPAWTDIAVDNVASENEAKRIVIETNRLPIPEHIEYKAWHIREIEMDVYTSDTAITTEELQSLVYEDVPGFVVKMMEYHEGGWEANPEYYRYRWSDHIGVKPWSSYADTSKTYGLLTIVYDEPSISLLTETGWTKEDRVAIDSANNAQLTTLATIIKNLTNIDVTTCQ